MYQLMIVDDEPLVIKAISYIIENNLPQITVTAKVSNGNQAIEVAREKQPDIIIMDIKLKGLNGLEAINEISRFLPGAIIIVVSAYDNFNYAQKAIKLGVLDYLLKPVDKPDIINILKKAIDRLESNQDQPHNPGQQQYYSFNPPWELEKKLFRAAEMGNKQHVLQELDNIFDYLDQGKNFQDIKQYCQELIAVILRLTYEYIPEDEFRQIDARKLHNNLEASRSFSRLQREFKGDINKLMDYISPAQKQDTNPVLLKAREFIDNNFQQDLSLDDIATRVSISPSYLSKLFKDNFGVTIIDYLTQKRLETASRLLKQTNLPVKKIAARAGYNDSNYFSKVFKKHTGLTPTDYRDNSWRSSL